MLSANMFNIKVRKQHMIPKLNNKEKKGRGEPMKRVVISR